MVNHGQFNWAPEGNETHQIEPGYYSGGTLDASKVYEQGKLEGFPPISFYVRFQTSLTTQASKYRFSIPEGYNRLKVISGYLNDVNRIDSATSTELGALEHNGVYDISPYSEINISWNSGKGMGDVTITGVTFEVYRE